MNAITTIDTVNASEAPSTTADTARQKILQIREALSAALIERDEAIDVLLCAFVCQEHVLFLGPPGTAKSMGIEALMQCIAPAGSHYVRRLLHKFCTADELIGPMDLGVFQEKKIYQRSLKNGAVDAHGLFLDEIFKANGALLNTLLTLLEERQYADQAGTIQTPLRMCAAASNEFPQEEILVALYDRLLFRHTVNYITDRRNRKAYLMAKAGTTKAAQAFVPPCHITLEEWDLAAAAAELVTIPEAVIDAKLDLLEKLSADGVTLSDRRQGKIIRAIKAAAWLDGDTEASVDHLSVFRFCAWNTPEELDKVTALLGTLQRSGVAQALGVIDEALRAYRARPTDLKPYLEALPELAVMLKKAGNDIKARVDGKQFTKAGEAKVMRRMVELRKAFEQVQADFSKYMKI